MLSFLVNQTACRRRCLCLSFFVVALFAVISAQAVAQVNGSNNAASDTIDPVRVGDKVEVRRLSSWIPGTVLAVADGKAEVETTVAGKASQREYSFRQIRFPNGEGQWAIWKNKSGKLVVEGRYIARDEKEVMIRTADGKDLVIEINDLALNLKMRVKATPITGKENAVNGVVPIKVGDEVQVEYFSKWHDGVVQSIDIGEVVVEYERNGRKSTGTYTFDEVRYPNGGWRWEMWKNAAGTLSFEGRYVGRDSTQVTIKKADGSDFVMKIDELERRLKRRVLSVPETAKLYHIDGTEPFRTGDEVQVVKRDVWYDGKVIELADGKVVVEYNDRKYDKVETEGFSLDEIRFPNGEGRWREWTSASGKFKIVGRYISRTKTHVTIRKLDGNEIQVENKKFSADIRRIINKTPVTGEETLIGGVNPIRVGDQVEVRVTGSFRSSEWVPAVIVESAPGGVMVELAGEKKERKGFSLTDVRYPNGEGGWQKWTTAKGDHEVIARFIRRSSQDVTLLKENGGFAKIPIKMLDSKRQRIVKNIPVIAEPPKEISFEGAQRIVTFFDNSPDFASFTTSVESVDSFQGLKGGVGIPLEHGNNVSEVMPLEIDLASIDADEPWYALGTFAMPDFKNPNHWTRLYWVCPSDQKYETGPGFQPEEQIVDYSAKQQRLLNLVLDGGQPVGFRTYKVQPRKEDAEPEFAWQVPLKETKTKRSFNRSRRSFDTQTIEGFKVQLVGDNQLLLSSSKSVALHDFEKRKIIYTISDVSKGHFVMHPSKRFFAVIKEGLVALIDVKTGATLAAEKTSEGGASGVGFSLDGTKVVLIDSEIRIWDLQANKKPSVYERRNLLQSGPGSVVMIDDKWLKAGSRLYSLTKEIVVWSYAGNGVTIRHDEMLGDMDLLAAYKNTSRFSRDKGSQVALVGLAKVPHAPAVEALGKLEKFEMLMLKPGSGVRIEAEGDKRIREGVLAAVEKAGWHEDPNAEVLIKASAKRGKTETMQYETYTQSRFGHRHRTSDSATTVSATPWEQSVQVIYDGKAAWSDARSSGVPYSVSLGEGKSISSEVQKATEPSYSLFASLKFPKEIIYPKYNNGLGRTQITVNGFVDELYAELPEEELEGELEDDIPSTEGSGE